MHRYSINKEKIMIYSDLDYNLIKTFIEVYECKSILLASKKLFNSQPAVTASIKRLESYLGGTLFIRTSKGVVPTTEGVNFYNTCISTTNLLDKGIDEFKTFNNLNEGYLNIGSSSTIVRKLLLPFLSAFNKKYPKVVIKITDADSDRLQKLLKNGELDLIILSEAQISDSFSVIPFTKTSDCIIAHPNFKKDYLSTCELQDYPFILQKRPSPNRDYFDNLCKTNNIEIVPKFEIGSFGLITDFVAYDMGIAFTIKDFVLDDIKLGRVKEIKSDLNITQRNVSLVTNKDSYYSSIKSKFIDEIKKYWNY